MGIFQKNDIRGVFGRDLTCEKVQHIGLCLPGLFGGQKKILVARDMRLSSEEIHASLVSGIIAAGGKVLELGQRETPAFYFAVGHYEVDGGVMITASHNPPEYNGLKIVGSGAFPIDSENGFAELEKCAEGEGSLSPASEAASKIRHEKFGEELSSFDIHRTYLDYLRSFLSNSVHGKIVIDCSHGMAGVTAGEIFSDTKLETVLLNADPDGRFPVHGPNPMKQKNLLQLRETVQKKEADLGVCFDGDGDRVVFVDAKGNSVSPDVITALLAEYLLRYRKMSGETVLYDLRSSMKVPEYIEKLGGNPFMSPIGHSRIKRLMREHRALLGGELTGHYYFRENNYCDSGWISVFYLLDLMEAEGKGLAELARQVGGYYFSGEINYAVEDRESVVSGLAERYRDGSQSRLDGLRVEYPDWWFIVRESTTEPYLRLVVEAKQAGVLEDRREELESYITTGGVKGRVR